MTAFNRENFIGEAIESVLASTYSNFELIIVDDKSTDKTIEIAKEYALNDQRIKIHINEKNLGQFQNRNKAATYASGSLIFWVDSDDMIKPDAIEYVVKQFNLHPLVNFSTIYQKSDLTKPAEYTPSESIRNNYFKNGFLNIGPGGTVIKPEYFKLIGGFPLIYGPVGDMYYNVKAAANSNILLLPYDYLIYRRHDGQEINNKYSYLCNGFRYLKDVMQFPELPLSNKEKKIVLKRNARQNLRSFLSYIKQTGEIKKAIEALRISEIKLKDII